LPIFELLGKARVSVAAEPRIYFLEKDRIVRQCTGAQGGLEAAADLLQDRVQRQLIVVRIDDENLPRLGLGTPRSVEPDEVPPCVRRPHRQNAHMAGRGLEVLGDTRRHVAIRKQRLRVTGRYDVELPVVVELPDGVERVTAVRRS